jgi:hypothetical protein
VTSPTQTLSSPLGSQRDRATWIGMAIGLVLVLSAVTLQLHPSYSTPSSAGRVPAGGTGSGAVSTAPEDVPQRITVAGAGIDAAVVPVAVTAGQLEVPEDGRMLGWWGAGAAPARGQGTVVVAGHVDTVAQGPGALYRLETLVRGQQVSVSTPVGPVTYRVEARQAYRKGRLPPDIFSTDGSPRLALITCGGSFDAATRTYAYNVVVYAVPV